MSVYKRNVGLRLQNRLPVAPGWRDDQIVAGSAGGVTGPVRDVVTKPEYLDVSLPPGKTLTHRTPRGHTVFAYVIGGKGVFSQQKDPYSYPAEGDGYFDMKRDRLIGDGHLVVFGDGDAVTVTAEGVHRVTSVAHSAPPGTPDAPMSDCGTWPHH